MRTKKDIFQEHLSAYLTADKQGKGEILTHACFVTGLHRKAAVRKFKRLQMHAGASPGRRGRPTTYGPDVMAALRDVWEAGNEVCGELLHPVTNEYLDILQRDGMWQHLSGATAQLRAMSEGTMKRRVGRFLKARRRRKGISTTKPSHLKQIVPVWHGPWKDKIKISAPVRKEGQDTIPENPGACGGIARDESQTTTRARSLESAGVEARN